MDNKELYKSPNKKHELCFIFEDEIRFGPSFYKIQLNNKIIKNRIFGLEFTWHPESKYLALQEWLTIDYSEGPITSLTIVDLEILMFARISKAEKGFINPLRFESDLIIFEKDYGARTVEFEIKLTEIKNWKK